MVLGLLLVEQSDAFVVYLDTCHDHLTDYGFGITPADAVRDVERWLVAPLLGVLTGTSLMVQRPTCAEARGRRARRSRPACGSRTRG